MQDTASPFPHHRTPATYQAGLHYQANGRESAAPLLTSSAGNAANGKRLSHWGRNVLRGFYHVKWHQRTQCAVVACLLWFFTLFVLLHTFLQVSGLTQSIYAVFSRPTSGLQTLLEDELVIPSPVVPPNGAFCGLCTEGLVVFRPASAATSLATTPAQTEMVVCVETMEEAWLSASESEPLSTVRDCVARLYNLGLLQPPRTTITAVNDTCAAVRVTVQVLSGESEEADRNKCSSGFVAELQISSTEREKVEVHTQRFPSWPLCPVASPEAIDAKDGHRGGSDGNHYIVPAYFATAAVRDTDADCDVPPPWRIDTIEDLDEVVLRFAGDAAQTTETSPLLASDLRCPTYFLTVHLGRFGRHHNQLQEILNGISLARRSNRTFILPPFVPALYMSYLRLNPELLYGWNALRRNGHYCVLSYAEARPILRRLRERDGVVSMERVSFAATADLHVLFNTTEEHDSYAWGSMPRVPDTDGAFVYDADEWFSMGVRRREEMTAHTASNTSSVPSPLTFHEARPPSAEECSGFAGPAPNKSPTQWERIRRCTTAFLRTYGDGDGRRESSLASRRQPRIVVISSVTAFHLRPTLTEMTRLLGLLRPSPTLTVEIGRYYRLYATQLQWPANTDPKRSFLNVLQPFRYKSTIGVHVRRREFTCREEAEHPSATIIAMSEARYQFDGTGKNDSAAAGRPITTVARLASDCGWNSQSLLHIYDTYASWMRSRQAQGLRRSRCFAHVQTSNKQVLRSYVAFDEQVGPIGSQLQAALQQRYNPLKKKRAANGYPPIYAAFYDHRPRKDLFQTYQEIPARWEHSSADTQRADGEAVFDVAAVPRTTDSLVEMLYPIAEQEALALGIDFFVLGNTGVFRGNIISSVSINVCLRRLGRGLPCHGVLAGYYEMLYKGYM
ncbi:phosphoglycan beta 1,2 arabinosyltransferase,(SCA like) [Leishmania infantum JPCM5]|uniref:Phosphoglycan beta 1,2 arabinosyltransferase,(SCA like) n=2 Tax=Leishmania infantum TaxID=5671 RepID=A4I9M1_LEIIN|nr:phosphoglycan beta 1,2 arabinosyltransferase,(SCA like) [Leishmania infantum JPCM5]CAC9536395.1 phosphoglycan_beta_1_-2_arabinosyltransferase_-_(SCA_like) [Leishmania infantum]CAM71524.1 phosphoglycan beta 1,2 arabinosyltransferase,(SCA like) [Leishmania infantum JPCM5]SUZ45417.1 phosphoglycan_beta_1_-2_arabinosyltransferase_-_(SCA_like) [Leishmania infantum]|eukprot:XP_001468440.1 phosphoglycan beta 1,2 arabinosyltransferase,(SCA like) [Leishmania infantum JPCM5]